MGIECTLQQQQQAQLVWSSGSPVEVKKCRVSRPKLPHANVNISGSTRSEKAHIII